MKRTLTMLAAMTLAYGLVGAASAGPGFNNKFSPDPVTVVCNDGDGNRVGQITYDGPQKMWPPNHKYQPTSITATADDADDMVTLDTEGTHDEFAEDGTEMTGAGNTDDDVNPAAAMDGPNAGSASNAHDIRSERSGAGDGRTYSIEWQATFTDDGDQGYGEVVCASAGFDGNEDAFQIGVPHDMRCDHWKGPKGSKNCA